jgi:hypothetical protein
MTIKAVVFDIGGVLERVQDDAWPEIWIGGWECRMNLPAGHVRSALAEHQSAGAMMTGEMSEAQIRELYADVLGLDEHQAQKMMAQMWDAYCGELDVALRDFAAGLRPKFVTAILSNSANEEPLCPSRRSPGPSNRQRNCPARGLGAAEPRFWDYACTRRSGRLRTASITGHPRRLRRRRRVEPAARTYRRGPGAAACRGRPCTWWSLPSWPFPKCRRSVSRCGTARSCPCRWCW